MALDGRLAQIITTFLRSFGKIIKLNLPGTDSKSVSYFCLLACRNLAILFLTQKGKINMCNSKSFIVFVISAMRTYVSDPLAISYRPDVQNATMLEYQTTCPGKR
jgi:hypothetical protein